MNDPAQELERLGRAIDAAPTSALYLERGRLLWRLQRHAAAMADLKRPQPSTAPALPPLPPWPWPGR